MVNSRLDVLQWCGPSHDILCRVYHLLHILESWIEPWNCFDYMVRYPFPSSYWWPSVVQGQPVDLPYRWHHFYDPLWSVCQFIWTVQKGRGYRWLRSNTAHDCSSFVRTYHACMRGFPTNGPKVRHKLLKGEPWWLCVRLLLPVLRHTLNYGDCQIFSRRPLR